MVTATHSYPVSRIGIIGGGQLGKMTAQIAKRMGFYVTVLDPQPRCPAEHIADAQIVGDLYDANKLAALAHLSDVVTFDVEHIDTETLKRLHQEGHTIYPSPYLLEIIQDKLKQKQVLEQHGVPVAPYTAVDKVDAAYLQQATFPLVQKARKGGYDGKGVVVLQSANDIDKVLHTPSLIEEYIDFEKELAVMVARSVKGEVACYPVVEMVFDDRTNICDIVTAPARIPEDITQKALEVAAHAVEALEGVGVFGVEMFLTKEGDVLVNEIAPRPHNSGHYTIEGCITCQFEQLVRIITGLPLGSTQLLKPVAMLNLLGEPDYQGTPVIEGLSDVLSIEGLYFHLYGKEITKPFRKMGHITVIDDDSDQVIAKLHKAKNLLKIKGQKQC
ncbi:5-(carboxyamino)imidazole ribonucleotide synthase [Candidatus Albibeggiatoa sp. nov. NOAA]|uniref:5-(carboxyamino)imidazole ribonucleotide synthase n=1 Tax=Candidatus Albibeggiatoa sp. nov. NOAA TaxID=3162724 RepID=UPI0032FF36A5|nr:5-(carboxyamino)imidazole ribonucleotide synthase [Thiotrichaceae bacterium]